MRARSQHPPYLPTWYTGTPSEHASSAKRIVVGAQGMSLSFADGSAAEDWSGGMFVNNIGWGRPEVAKALADQALRLSWTGPERLADVRIALARDLRSVLPSGLTTVHYGVGGSDGMEAAVRAARMVTRRKKVLAFSYAYHGDTMVTESLSDAMTPYGDPRLWIVRAPSAYEFWERLGDWDAAYARCLDAFQAVLRRNGARTFAAVVAEPVSGSLCGVPFRREVAAGIRETCNHFGIKVLADEVITGFGRTGEWFGSPSAELEPDAIVLAKGLTGGYAPLGAVVFEDGWGGILRRRGFPHGLTSSGHPLACTAARETIRILKEEDLVVRSKRLGAYLRQSLDRIAAGRPRIVRDVRGVGLLQALELRGRGRWRDGRPHPAARRTQRLVDGLRRDRILVYATPDGSSIVLSPPFIVTNEQVDRFASCLDARLAELERTG